MEIEEFISCGGNSMDEGLDVRERTVWQCLDVRKKPKNFRVLEVVHFA